jgi:cytochrome c biogenesis protein CcmG/thiol:disulfide interchange protein DsbE
MSPAYSLETGCRISYDETRIDHGAPSPSNTTHGANANHSGFFAVLSAAKPSPYRSSAAQTMSATRRQAFIFLLGCACLGATLCSASALLDLNGLRGRVVYLDFWASWCAPCREAFPWMRAMQSTYERQGLTVIAVNLDHDRAEAYRFLKTFQPNFEVQFDPQGVLAEQFNVAGMPTSVLIDRHGVLRYTHIGFRAVDRQNRTREIQQLLADN